MTTLSSTVRDAGRQIGSRAVEWAGGTARLEIVLLLAAILGLDSAEKSAVSAVAGELKQVFGLDNTDIGLLVAASSLVGALFTLPIGTLIDRLNRKKVVVAAIALWTVAVVVSGMATSFTMLLVTRMFLGAVTAAAAPSVASLVGDFFPPEERARIYGAVLGGELVGIGIGFSLSGEVSTLLGWRWSFYALGMPSAAIGFLIWRFLPEPARGGQGYIRVGQEELKSEFDDAAQDASPEHDSNGSAEIRRRIRAAGVRPRRELILHENPAQWTIWETMRYMLRIPSYRLLVMASALGYFFFAGVRAFAMIFVAGQYGLSRGTASMLVFVVGFGALVGVVASGRISQWLFERGWLDARVVVPGGALFLAAVLTAPAIWTHSAVLGFGLLTLASGFLAAANPPLDAARLDIVHARLWGRAEAGRMALRGLLEGIAPILFGWISGLIGGSRGLDWTFSIMLIPVLAASALAIPARRSYPIDVATADASARAIAAA
jgi:predicted MFS family arabinose efflux permease